jgi:amidophosphoribosyltransferase
MTDAVKHECGFALIRLLKPLEYYQLKYGSWRYGLQKLYLLMEKQHNRGQDGAGVASVKFDMPPGHPYIFRERSLADSAIDDVFKTIFDYYEKHKGSSTFDDSHWAKLNLPFASELYLGHLRYGTFGKYNIENVHPVRRHNNWKTRNLVLAGNFNLTNVDECFDILVELGQNPTAYSDTITILENIGHFLDREVQQKFNHFKTKERSNVEISELIADNMDIANVLRDSSKRWDGGYAIAGLLGHGDAFVMRDPWGIRPAYYYHDDEVAVVTSERPAIQTGFNVDADLIHEVDPGYAIIIRKNGQITLEEVRKPQKRKACSFERIYFSRGNDQDIYHERKKLGELLVPAIMKSIDDDIENTVFSFIPNTAEVAFYGMVKTMDRYLLQQKRQKLIDKKSDISKEEFDSLFLSGARVEKIALKDIKLRTFITQDSSRKDLVTHIYDITYGTIRKGIDNLVVIDDSIVRGTTLRESIIRILDRLGPKKIVIVSSSPQIRYPDCYGIDMAKIADFIAFHAAILLLKESGKESIINEVYRKSKEQQEYPKEKIKNYVKEIYKPFTNEQISARIAKILKAPEIKADLQIVYQTVENLHVACPNHLGDWYFTGDYPTPGGNKVVNNAFINYVEGRDQRAY